MATQIDIKFNPAGFAECLAGMDDQVKAVAEQIVSQTTGPGSYSIEVVHEPRFHDAQYGVARPVAVARITGDAEASASEAEDKTMSKAVY